MLPNISQATSAETNHKIIVTLPPLSGLAAMLLPEIQSQCLLSASADPHHFQPSPRQVSLLQQGNLLLRATRDDQGWPINTTQSQVFDLWQQKSHAWLQFDTVYQILPQLSLSLIKTFPQYQITIEANLTLALAQVNQLQKEWRQTLSTIKKSGVLMEHPAWLGLLQAEQVPVWSVLELHQHGHEQGPKHLEEALELLKAHPDALLLASKRHSNRSLEWLNNHDSNKHKMIVLDALGSCNQPWNELMRANLEQLQKQL